MIDIIIPAYNAHKTINKTLLSICMQSIKDFVNVYIVNDCSNKDYTEEILKFKNIIKIKELKLKKNSGPGIARQYGIDHSNNKFIYFLDADDVFVEPDSLKYLYENIKNNDVICGNVIYDEKYEVWICKNSKFQLHGKLYRRSYIEKNNFRFNSSRNGEDNCFNRLLKIGTEKYVNIDKWISVYCYTENSITKKNVEYYMYDEIESMTKNMLWFADEAEKRNFDTYKILYELYTELLHFVYVYINYQGLVEDFSNIYEGFKILYERIQKYGVKIKKKDSDDIYLLHYKDAVPYNVFFRTYLFLVNKSKISVKKN